MLFSTDYFDAVIARVFDMLGTSNYAITEGVVFSECFPALDIPSIYFMFNELWVELKGVDYMIDVSAENDHSLC